MARFRIVQRPSSFNPQHAVFYIEERKKWWHSWDRVDVEATFEKAEKRVLELQRPPVETKVIKEYVL
jgi:hypothetical protein